jgi:hypothetical protein
MVGANDVTHRIDKTVAVRHLEQTVRALRALGTEVVVGTCPDLGTIQPIPQPLRLIGRRFSRDMAAAQTVAVVEAGGRTVSLGDLLGPEFAERPHEMFSEDRFHPSPAGYARAASALLPSVYAALGVWSGEPTEERAPDTRRGEGVGPVAVAAVYAVRDPGTEVSATQIAGQSRGPRGRWAMLLRRPHNPVPDRHEGDGSTLEKVAGTGMEPTSGLAADHAAEADPDRPMLGSADELGESNATPTNPATRHTIEAD